MQLLLSLIGKFLRVHPLTAKTKTFGAGVAAIGSCVVAIGGMVYGGDTNMLDYAVPAVGSFVSILHIFHRDSNTKLMAFLETLQKDLPGQKQ
jgi:hypothetical protein